jgi:hypothetical protein
MWRTVVFAGAMLAVPGIATAQDTGGTGTGTGQGSAEPANPPKKIAKKKKKKKKKKRPRTPPPNPCGESGPPVGRGFILS